MKANVRRSYLSLPPKEKAAIDQALVKWAEDKVNHEEAELQKIWLQMACIVLHDAFGFGHMRCLTFLGNWKRMYKRMTKISSKEEQDAFLKTEMDKIFGEDGYPYEFIDSLEKRGDA